MSIRNPSADRGQATLEALLNEYRKTHREWNAALSGDYDRGMTDEESAAHQNRLAEPCHAATEAMIEAPVLSLGDIATKLRFLSEIVAAAGVEGRVINAILRDIDAAKGLTAPPPAFSPSAFVEQVIEALLPFVDEDGDDLKDGTTHADLVVALRPLFGDYTVHDAVLVHFMLNPAGEADGEAPDGRDNPRSTAIFAAREALVDYVCNADASSALCALMRAYLAEHEGDIEQSPYRSIHRAIRVDLSAVRYGQYQGQRFGNIGLREGGWDPWKGHRTNSAAESEGGGHDA